jgi:hypothetical protein
MERIQRGEHTYIRVNNTPAGDGVMADCDSDPELDIWDAAGKLVLDGQAMSKQNTGDYYYQYQVTTTSPIGWYRWRAWLINDSAYEPVDGAFEVL